MIRNYLRILPLLAASLALAGPAFAQAQPAKPKPATKKPATAQARPSQTAASSAQAAVPSDQPSLLGQFGDWGAYTAAPGGKKVCFVIAKPNSARTDPPNRPRDQPYFFISTRPAEKVKEEISTVVGYPLKPDSANAVIGAATFALYAQNDGAWIKNAAEESRLIDAMRKGAELVIKGTSSRGTDTTDTYSLRGLSQALDRAAQDCK